MNPQHELPAQSRGAEEPKGDEPGVYLPTPEQIAAECARIRNGSEVADPRTRRRLRTPVRAADDLE